MMQSYIWPGAKRPGFVVSREVLRRLQDGHVPVPPQLAKIPDVGFAVMSQTVSMGTNTKELQNAM